MVAGKRNYYWSTTAFRRCESKLRLQAIQNGTHTCTHAFGFIVFSYVWPSSSISHWFVSLCGCCHNQEVIKGQENVLLHFWNTHVLSFIFCVPLSHLPVHTPLTNAWLQKQMYCLTIRLIQVYCKIHFHIQGICLGVLVHYVLHYVKKLKIKVLKDKNVLKWKGMQTLWGLVVTENGWMDRWWM